MNNRKTNLVEEHLQSLAGMQEAVTDEFFYTRLRARMEKSSGEKGWRFPLKPVWVIGTLAVLLAVNGYTLFRQTGMKKAILPGNATLQGFAESYDQSNTSSY